MPVYDIDYDAIDAYVADMPNRAGFARRFAASRLPKDEVDTFLEQMKESILEHPAIGMRPSHPDYATRLAEWNHENRKFLNLQELTPAYVLRHFATERPPSTPPKAKPAPSMKGMGKAVPPVLVSKDYPESYPSDAAAILKAMSFGDGMMLVGSMSLRSQQYAGDYDGYEVVKESGAEKTVLTRLVKRFQEMIRTLQKMKNVFIGDIKAGVVSKWKIIPTEAKIVDGKVVGYEAAEAHAAVARCLDDGIITAAEAKKINASLTPTLTPFKFLELRQTLKYHVVRWKPADVLSGTKKLADGSTMTLAEAFTTPGIAKMDVIGLVNNSRYTDFSVIYQFRIGDKILNDEPLKIDQSLKENIIGLKEEGNYFKVLKRMFALAKFQGDTVALEELHNVLNSDLGRLYQIAGDIGTLKDLLENHPDAPLDKVRFEVDQFIGRLSNLYTLKDYLAKEPQVIQQIHSVIRMPKEGLLHGLEKLGNYLDKVLQSHAGRWLKSF
jgi:hypothetical protein